MARSSAKKKSTKTPATEAPTKATKADQAAEVVAVSDRQAEPVPTDGAALLAELESRCATLRSWHEESSNSFAAREAQLNEQAAQLARQQEAVAKTHQQLNAELEQLAATHTAFEADRAELGQMRRDLEAEWSALRNLRDAQAKLGHELDAERRRLNRRAFKITTPPANTADAPALPKLKAA